MVQNCRTTMPHTNLKKIKLPYNSQIDGLEKLVTRSEIYTGQQLDLRNTQHKTNDGFQKL